MPVEPMPQKQYKAVRTFRWVVFIACTAVLIYLLFQAYEGWGIGLGLLIGLLWGVDINRGNQTEDYVFQHYENPLTDS